MRPGRRRRRDPRPRSRRTAAASRRTRRATPTGPVAYEAYLPGYLALGWTGKWDDLPAAHFASIAFDLLCLLGLALVGLRFGGHAAGGDARLRLGRLPVHAVRLELEHERRAAAAVPDLGLLARHARRSRAARSSRSSGWTKFAPLLVAPLWASYPERRAAADARLRRRRSLVATLAAFSILLLEPTRSHAAHEFLGRARSAGRSTASRRSRSGTGASTTPGLPDLHIAPAGARGRCCSSARLAVYFVPRRKSPLQLAALTAALLIGFELVLTHWFYLYLPWFFPFAAFAVLAPGRRAAARPPSERRVERPRQELVGVD